MSFIFHTPILELCVAVLNNHNVPSNPHPLPGSVNQDPAVLHLSRDLTGSGGEILWPQVYSPLYHSTRLYHVGTRLSTVRFKLIIIIILSLYSFSSSSCELDFVLLKKLHFWGYLLHAVQDLLFLPLKGFEHAIFFISSTTRYPSLNYLSFDSHFFPNLTNFRENFHFKKISMSLIE